MITLHKNTKLTPMMRRQIWKDYQSEKLTVVTLSKKYHVSRPVIYVVLKRARVGDFYPHKSTRQDYLTVRYGIRRLAKVEKSIEERLKRQAKRYNKSYPGEMLHVDTKRLPLLQGERRTSRREYLFVGIDDYSRELYAGIYPDKSQCSSSAFLSSIIRSCPYTIEVAYSDNGTEYKGNTTHEFVKLCQHHRIAQRFTKVRTPRTNGKAERVIRTLMDMWHDKEQFSSRQQRQESLVKFVNFYNTVKGHASLNGRTPLDQLKAYFFDDNL